MSRRSAVPASPAFEAITQEAAQFRDLIAIVVKASPEAIFQALHEVTLRDMKLAWILGELRYLPSRLAGHMPAADSKPFKREIRNDPSDLTSWGACLPCGPKTAPPLAV